ncbi:hypothetical protein [Streptomyces sp. NPDC017964]|uniref:hypothetical protein n=1 Tax=Streptomyces sp. NPDC017964 TaxID=3365022 RepID=UPI00378D791F
MSFALGAVLMISGCGSSDGGDKPSAKSPATTPAPSKSSAKADPEAAEKASVLDSYRRMWAEQMKAYRKADAKGTDLTKYASLDALGKFRLDLAHMRKYNTVIRGELGHEDTKVSALDMNAKTPKATVTDCVDLSDWQTYDVKAKKVIPLPSNQPMRYMATAKAERWNGHWMVTDYTPDGERKC